MGVACLGLVGDVPEKVTVVHVFGRLCGFVREACEGTLSSIMTAHRDI